MTDRGEVWWALLDEKRPEEAQTHSVGQQYQDPG
jgi:hypothetical protein